MRNKSLFLRFMVLCSTLLLLSGLSLQAAWGQGAPADHDEDFWKALTHTQYIQEGNKGPIVYLFMDPNCPYCHQLYTWLQNPAAANKIRLRVIVVGFLTPSSEAKAAAILGASNPRAALQKNEDGFAIHDDAPEGGIAPAAPALVKKEAGILHRNFAFLMGKESLLSDVPPNTATVPLLVYLYHGQTRYLPTLPDYQQWQEILHSN
ncbi:thioredoxin fold domain-containing protein [Acidithiobacillus sp. IBUN Pt1247-S3]|uniref:thioredoxin fold domain-containing protein n=1 Tax=Acidithiobacillus sp. IBUN Pt1247-S3 TaxID=3166642 RepID=UPI0034E55429